MLCPNGNHNASLEYMLLLFHMQQSVVCRRHREYWTITKRTPVFSHIPHPSKSKTTTALHTLSKKCTYLKMQPSQQSLSALQTAKSRPPCSCLATGGFSAVSLRTPVHHAYKSSMFPHQKEIPSSFLLGLSIAHHTHPTTPHKKNNKLLFSNDLKHALSC